MKKIALFCIILFILGSCSSKKIKENINKTGDVAGQAIGEFTSGVTTGVKKSIDAHVTLTDSLKESGIEFGKVVVSSDSSVHNENLLIVYVIFNKDYKGTMTAKAFDNKNLEMGRVKVVVQGKKDETKYIEFHFDPRTDIDKDSKLTIE